MKCLGQRHPKEPSRRVRSDPCRCAHRFDDWSEEVSNRKTETETRRTSRREIPLGFAAPDPTVPYGTVLWRDAFPGTSCQATIGVVPTDALADISRQHLASRFSNMERDQILNTRTGDKTPAYFLVVPLGHLQKVASGNLRPEGAGGVRLRVRSNREG